MEVSESLHARAVTALWIEEDDGHWRSTLTSHHGETHRLRDGARRVSQLLVLRNILMGDPVGQLSNVCGRSECVNPYHYEDQAEVASANEQLAWRVEVQNVDIMTILARSGVVHSAPSGLWYDGTYWYDGISEDDVETMSLRIADICGDSPCDVSQTHGMTSDMGCYHCGKRFDPLAHRNQVICPECWTDEDQAKAEASSAD